MLAEGAIWGNPNADSPMRGRPLAPIKVSPTDRETLERRMRRPITAHALAQRARIVLSWAAGTPNGAMAE